MSIAEVAQRLRVHRNTVEGWYRLRGLPAVKVGNVIRIRDVDLHAWLSSAIVTCGGGDDAEVQQRQPVSAYCPKCPYTRPVKPSSTVSG